MPGLHNNLATERASAFRLMGEMLAADGPEDALAAYTTRWPCC
jgi:hypothetical protein